MLATTDLGTFDMINGDLTIKALLAAAAASARAPMTAWEIIVTGQRAFELVVFYVQPTFDLDCVLASWDFFVYKHLTTDAVSI